MYAFRSACFVLALFLFAAPPRTEAQQASPPRPKVVLRIARSFLVKLTRQPFTQDEPIDTTSMGATVHGSAHVAGGYDVQMHRNRSESDFDLLVKGDITTQMNVTRKPVQVVLNGAAPFQASRRVSFDGNAFTAAPVNVRLCYHSGLDAICPLHPGPAAPLIRRVARPIVLRSLPDADASADQQIASQIQTAVAQETDRVITVLNEVVTLNAQVTAFLRAHGIRVEQHPFAVATTEQYVLVGAGFAPGESPTLPPEAGPAQAPVEIWLHHKLPNLPPGLASALQKRLDADWAKIKPAISARIARHSAALAKRFDETGHQVELTPLPGDRDWHVIRFAKRFHAVAAQSPP